MKKIFIIIALAQMLHVSSDQVVPKEGGLCFRFDDNQTVKKWTDMAEVFRPFGYKFSMSINSHQAYTPEFLSMLQDLEKEGHEIMDHTANHSVFTLNIDPEIARQVSTYDHMNGDKAYFRGIVDESKLSPPFVASFKEKLMSNLSPEALKLLKTHPYVYIPNSKSVYFARQNGDEIGLRSFWHEDNVNLPEQNEVTIQLLPTHGGFKAPDDLLCLQVETSLANFKRAGLKPPVTWIQPGGSGPTLTAENLRFVCKRFNYTGAATYANSARKTFNESDPDLKRFAMMWGDFSLEKSDISKLKHNIATALARHQVLVGHSHMDFRHLAGGWQEYLERHKNLLQWCKEKNVPVHTQREWTEILYRSKTDPAFNIMPPLTVDRDEDGIPDGYELASTTSLQHNALVATGDGVAFKFQKLTGMEIGQNHFSYTCEGAPGTEVTVKIQVFVKPEAPEFTLNVPHAITSAGAQTFTIPLEVPEGALFLNLEILASGVTAPLKLSNFKLVK